VLKGLRATELRRRGPASTDSTMAAAFVPKPFSATEFGAGCPRRRAAGGRSPSAEKIPGIFGGLCGDREAGPKRGQNYLFLSFFPRCGRLLAVPEEGELAAIRRSSQTGLPFGRRGWAENLCKRLCLDLTIRPRGRPRKDASHAGE
jgi:hypothetical protein